MHFNTLYPIGACSPTQNDIFLQTPPLLSLLFPKNDDKSLSCIFRGVAQPGSAPALGAGCRRFESSRPDHTKTGIRQGVTVHNGNPFCYETALGRRFGRHFSISVPMLIVSHPKTHLKSLPVHPYPYQETPHKSLLFSGLHAEGTFAISKFPYQLLLLIS